MAVDHLVVCAVAAACDEHIDPIQNGLLGETFGVASLPRAPYLQRVTLFTHLLDGGTHPRVPRTLSIQNDAETFHSTASFSVVVAKDPASAIGITTTGMRAPDTTCETTEPWSNRRAGCDGG
jgi:hypothetical protein